MNTSKKPCLSKEVREQIIRHIRDDGVPVTAAAEEHGVSTQTIYAYQLPDGISFIHFMAFKSAIAEKKHQTAPHTKIFVRVLYPNCSRKPTFVSLKHLR